jgi:hypothetical protein
MNSTKRLNIGLATGLLIAASASKAGESATYDIESGLLFIPAVSAPALPGAIQNVVLENIDGEYFRLKDMWNATLILAPVNIELISKGTAPVNYFLSIDGWISPCSEFGRSVQTQDESTIYVNLYYESDMEPGTVCVAQVSEYNHIIPLDTYSLEAGEYSIVFNGSSAASFTLESKNVLE